MKVLLLIEFKYLLTLNQLQLTLNKAQQEQAKVIATNIELGGQKGVLGTAQAEKFNKDLIKQVEAVKSKPKKKVKDVEVKSKEAITLEEADNEIFAQFLQDNDIDNVRDIGGKSKTKSGLTKEQQQDLETEVEQTKEELNKKNCQ
jgi:hypothetical protein